MPAVMQKAGSTPWFSRRIRLQGRAGDSPVIHTQRLLLRPLVMRDARDFFTYARDPRVAEYVLWDPHTSLGQTRSILRNLMASSKQETLHTKAMVLKESGRMVGTLGLVARDWENQAAEVGFSLAADLWGQGLMTEALRAYLAYLFHQPGIHRVEAQHDVYNPASGVVMQKAGMQAEGILKERIHYKGRYASVALYAALREQWLQEQGLL